MLGRERRRATALVHNLANRIEDRQNNNRRERRRPPQQVEGEGHDDGEYGILRLANPDELLNVDEEGNSVELRAYKHTVNYYSVEPAKWSIPCILAGWLLLFLPDSASRYNILGFDLLRHGVPLALVIGSVMKIAIRGDIEFYRPLRTFEMRVIQLLMVVLLGFSLDWLLTIGPGLGFFYFDLKAEKNIFMEQVELARVTGFRNFVHLSNWCKINTQLLVTSIGGLLIVDVTRSFWKMYRHSRVIATILEHEFFAYLKPYLCLLSSILLLNIISFNLPPANQTIFVWECLFAMIFVVVGYLGYYIWTYPEIPLRRPIGIRGYLYMDMATTFQTEVGMTVQMLLSLVRDLYYHTAPGAFMENVRHPGLILGPPLFINQILKELPYDQWTRKRLFDPSFDTFNGLLSCILIVRYIKLRCYSTRVLQRIVQLLQEANNPN